MSEKGKVTVRSVLVDRLIKGKKANIGETRTWSNGKKYKKTSQGWVEVAGKKMVEKNKDRVKSAYDKLSDAAKEFITNSAFFEKEVSDAEIKLHKIINEMGGVSGGGLVPDRIKFSDEYQKANADFHRAFTRKKAYSKLIPKKVMYEVSMYRRFNKTK